MYFGHIKALKCVLVCKFLKEKQSAWSVKKPHLAKTVILLPVALSKQSPVHPLSALLKDSPHMWGAGFSLDLVLCCHKRVSACHSPPSQCDVSSHRVTQEVMSGKYRPNLVTVITVWLNFHAFQQPNQVDHRTRMLRFVQFGDVEHVKTSVFSKIYICECII